MKSMKKTLSCILALTMAASMYSMPASAEEETITLPANETVSETDAENTADEEIISDNDAAVQDFEISAAGVLTKYKGVDENVVIPGTIGTTTITAIGNEAFKGNTTMKSVTIPTTVTSIGNYAFRDCTLLTSIVIPASVQSIGSRAFSGCTKLESIKLNEGLQSIGAYAFSISRMYDNIGTSPVKSAACTALKEITIPSTVTSIGDHAFSGCTALTSAYIRSAGDVSISDCVFEECTALETVSLSSHVTAIGYRAFFRCESLKKIDVPASVTSIGRFAFSGCTSLEEVNLKNGLKSIGASAFGVAHMYEDILTSPITTNACISLKEIVIPSTVTSIGNMAFDNCSALKLAVIQSHSSDDTIINLGSLMFASCTALEYIILSDSIMGFANDTFNGCKSVKGIYYQGAESDWEKITNVSSAPSGVKMYYNAKVTVIVSSIEVATLPAKVKYAIGDALALKGATINATYSNGMVINYDIEKDMVSGFDSSEAGTSTVTVKFHNITDTFTVTIKGAEIIGISVAKNPDKLEYQIGEELDLTGGVINAVDENGVTVQLPMTADMVSGFDSSTAGTKTVMLTYEGVTTNFKVTVIKPAEITGISIAKNPDKLQYQIGEELDLTGGIIKVVYDNGVTEQLTMTADMVSGYDNSKIGKQTLKVEYKGKSTTLNINVINKPIATLDDTPIESISAALKGLKSGEHTIFITSPVTEKTITIPKNLTKVTIICDGGVTLTTNTITANSPLVLDDVTISGVNPAKPTVIKANSDFSANSGTFGNVTIKGKAELSDITINGTLKLTAKANGTTDTLEYVTITKKVTTNNNIVFENCPEIGAVTSKGTVTVEGNGTKAVSIAANAKTGESVLENVTVEKKVTSAGNLKFIDCPSIGTVTAKGTVTVEGGETSAVSITANAKEGESVLENVTVDKKITVKDKLTVNGTVKASGAISCAELNSTDGAELTFVTLAVTKNGITKGSAKIELVQITKKGETVDFTPGKKDIVVVKTFKPKNSDISALSAGGQELVLSGTKVIIKKIK